MKYDLVLNAHTKDINKIPFCISSIKKYFDIQPENIYVVCPQKIEYENAICILDDQAIEIKKHEIQFKRPNWIFQQLLKICQNFTKNDIYMVVDSDVLFNRKISIKQAFYISDREQHHDPYFKMMKYLGVDKVFDQTFINDFMIFDKKICKEIVGDQKEFLNFLNKHFSDDCYLAEFELYGNYVLQHYPGLYDIIQTKVATLGKYIDPTIEAYNTAWSEIEISKYIEFFKDKDIDLFTIHSWT